MNMIASEKLHLYYFDSELVTSEVEWINMNRYDSRNALM